MDFADGCLVALSEKLGIQEIATIYSDFDVYKLHRNRKFKTRIGR